VVTLTAKFERVPAIEGSN